MEEESKKLDEQIAVLKWASDRIKELEAEVVALKKTIASHEDILLDIRCDK